MYPNKTIVKGGNSHTKSDQWHCTLIQLEEKHKGQENGQQPTQPSTEHKQAAEFPAHEGCVMQGPADGNIWQRELKNVKFGHPPMKIEKNSWAAQL